MAADLRAALALESEEVVRLEDLIVSCHLVNDGDTTATISLAPFSSPSLALEIVDEADEPVLLPPPPIPSAEVAVAVLRPGESWVQHFRGFVPSWTSAGRYRVRFRYRPGIGGSRWVEGDRYSDWSDFRVQAE